MINYIKQNLKNIILDIFVIFFNFIIIVSCFIVKQVNNLDEIWNFNTARQIMKGLIPYKDISMITTPLLPTLNAIILKIFGDELFIFRILEAAVLCSILFFIYKILTELLENRTMSIISIETILIMYNQHFYLDYNFFSLLLLLLMEFIEIKFKEKQTKTKHILIGIIAGLAVCTKQTIGIFIATLCVLVPIINNKEDVLKNKIKRSTFRILGIMIPITIFIVTLFVTNSFTDFIDYAILGIKNFDNTISYKKLLQNDKIYIKLLAIAIPIFIVLMIIFECVYIKSKKLINKKSVSKFNILTLYSFPMLITIYPISDTVHFLIAILPSIIVIEYLFFKAIIEISEKINLKDKKYIFKIISSATIIILAIIMLIPTITNYKEYSKLDKSTINHYSKLQVNKGLEEKVRKLENFYKEYKEDKKIILMDPYAALYDIPLDIYNKNYDMFLKGNIGKYGEDGLIAEIQNSKNCIYLIKKEGEPMNWQAPTKVINYVRNNLEKQGIIENFEIYYKR